MLKIMVLMFCSSWLISNLVMAKGVDTSEPAILLIGGSYGETTTPFNDEMISAGGGYAVNAGSYLSLGNALIRNKKLPGFVINVAQAGATTFDRRDCLTIPECGTASWMGYDKQFTKALTYVTQRDPNNPDQLIYNADYVIILKSNDCMHSASFDMPQSETQPCSIAEVNEFIDRLLAVGQRALDAGITPIFDVFPKWDDLDIADPIFGLLWRIDEAGYHQMRTRHMTRIANEMPEAILLDMWKDIVPIADGLHPDYASSKRAANRTAKAIIKHRKAKAQEQ